MFESCRAHQLHSCSFSAKQRLKGRQPSAAVSFLNRLPASYSQPQRQLIYCGCGCHPGVSSMCSNTREQSSVPGSVPEFELSNTFSQDGLQVEIDRLIAAIAASFEGDSGQERYTSNRRRSRHVTDANSDAPWNEDQRRSLNRGSEIG